MKTYTKEELIDKLIEIKNGGWIRNARVGNAGGIGNTLEDLLHKAGTKLFKMLIKLTLADCFLNYKYVGLYVFELKKRMDSRSEAGMTRRIVIFLSFLRKQESSFLLA
ncbi:hypothetical protein [Candidatus Magnetomonas plexicatena]|uniref:hypothetical protein n=1 Tax=Candidatus Magnetomonas plexicatena TaxID=2552947 RepID=UPI00110428C6|nr:hypothetical protein E2O03_000830 [Nitrospirales bacterium LBB_01]